MIKFLSTMVSSMCSFLSDSSAEERISEVQHQQSIDDSRSKLAALKRFLSLRSSSTSSSSYESIPAKRSSSAMDIQSPETPVSTCASEPSNYISTSLKCKRQDSKKELDALKESHLALRVTLILPEGELRDPLYYEEPAPPQGKEQRAGMLHENASWLDLNAAIDEGAWFRGSVEKARRKTPVDEGVWFGGQDWSVSGAELAEAAGRCIAPRDVLFG